MKKNYVFLIISVLALVFSGCVSTPEPSVIQAIVVQTQAALPTATSYPTYTPLPPLSTLTPLSTFTPYPTFTLPPTQTPLVVIVTTTSSPTPLFTPTITQTPTKTPIPSPTRNPLQMDKRGGFYLVNVDIAPGIWRNNGTSDDCYWAVTTSTGKIISNHFGMGGGTMYIPATGYQVELKSSCGTWIYLGQ
jgi:hypothetical protein